MFVGPVCHSCFAVLEGEGRVLTPLLFLVLVFLAPSPPSLWIEEAFVFSVVVCEIRDVLRLALFVLALFTDAFSCAKVCVLSCFVRPAVVLSCCIYYMSVFVHLHSSSCYFGDMSCLL